MKIDGRNIIFICGMALLVLVFGGCASYKSYSAGRLPANIDSAAFYIDMGNLPAAESILVKILEKEPSNLEALALKNRVLAGAYRFDEARKNLEGLIRSNRMNPALYSALGYVKYEAGNHDAAREAFLKALKLNKKRADAHLGLVKILNDRYNDLEYRWALNRYPLDTAGLLARSGYHRASRDIYLQVIKEEKFSEPKAFAYMCLSRLDLAGGDRESAASNLKEAVRLFPGVLEEKDVKNATMLFTTVEDKDLLKKIGKKDGEPGQQVDEEVKKETGGDESSMLVPIPGQLFNDSPLSLAPEESDKIRRSALAHLEIAGTTSPDSPELHNLTFFWNIRNKALSDILKEMDGVPAGKRGPSYYETRGRLLYIMGRYREASSMFQDAMKKTGPNPRALYYTAESEAAGGIKSKALAALHKALEINPYHVPSMLMLGKLYEEKGDIKGSFNSYLKALKVDPGNGPALLSLYYLGKNYPRKSYPDAISAVNESKNDPVTRQAMLAVASGMGDKDAREMFIEEAGTAGERLPGTKASYMPGREELFTIFYGGGEEDKAWRFALGKLQFFTRHFPEADEQFLWVINRRKQESPDLSDRIHPLIWLARVYMFQERFAEAADLLSEVNHQLKSALSKDKSDELEDLFGMMIGTFPENIEVAPGAEQVNLPLQNWTPDGWNRIPMDDYYPGAMSHVRRAQYFLGKENYPQAVREIDKAVSIIRGGKKNQ